MKCCNCSVEISREFKAAISANRCPACNKQIVQSGNIGQLIPLMDLLNEFLGILAGGTDGIDTEALAIKIISTFNVRSKSDKEEVVPARETKAVEPGSDEEHKQRQMNDAKARLQQLRDEAYKDAVREQWGMAPGEEQLDPDIGEALVQQIDPQVGPDAGQALVDQKQKAAYAKMLSGTGKVKRG